jgi:hypothetical protein
MPFLTSGNIVLLGVSGESSFVFEDKFLFRRLDDDMFFRIGGGGGGIALFVRFGDGGPKGPSSRVP